MGLMREGYGPHSPDVPTVDGYARKRVAELQAEIDSLRKALLEFFEGQVAFCKSRLDKPFLAGVEIPKMGGE